MTGQQIKVSGPISPVLTIKLVAMATSLERSQKENRILNLNQMPTKDENLVKVGQVERKIICLKRFIF